MRINLPTWLTLFRVLLLPIMVVVFYLPFRWASYAAAAVFVLAGITDWLDGWLARRLNQISPFGAFLDPVADKLMVVVTLFLVVESHHRVLQAHYGPVLPQHDWFGVVLAVTAAIIVGREISVSALREWMAAIGMRATVRVAFIGKLKTVMQMFALVVLIVEHNADTLRLYHVGEVLLVIAGVLTIWSGLFYLRAAWPYLKGEKKGRPIDTQDDPDGPPDPASE